MKHEQQLIGQNRSYPKINQWLAWFDSAFTKISLTPASNASTMFPAFSAAGEFELPGNVFHFTFPSSVKLARTVSNRNWLEVDVTEEANNLYSSEFRNWGWFLKKWSVFQRFQITLQTRSCFKKANTQLRPEWTALSTKVLATLIN